MLHNSTLTVRGHTFHRFHPCCDTLDCSDKMTELLLEGPRLWTSFLTVKRRSHSFDNFINLEKLDMEVWPRRCRSLCSKRWDEEMRNDFINGSSSEYDSSDSESDSSKASVSSFDRLMDLDEQVNTSEILDKDMEMMQPVEVPENFDKPMKAPGDFQSFRNFHQWVPSSYTDTQLPKDIYCRPSPSYIWKARRRKFTKRKNVVKKRFEILELASDIDTDDDCHEEQIESVLDDFRPKGYIKNAKSALAQKNNWLKQKLRPLRQRRCSCDLRQDIAGKKSRRRPVFHLNKSSSEEDTCDVDRESDYEYFHVWGESESSDQHSDLNVAEDIDEGDDKDDFGEASSLLEIIPAKKAFQIRRNIIFDYDAPSPEPFLPETNELNISEPVECSHKVPVCDTLAMNRLSLGISDPPADMPRFHCIPPCDIIEKPFESDDLSETSYFETSCKRAVSILQDDGECTPSKVSRIEVVLNSSPPSPSDSDESFSPPNSDDENVNSSIAKLVPPIKHLAKEVVKFCNDSSPFHTPASDMDIQISPPMIPHYFYKT